MRISLGYIQQTFCAVQDPPPPSLPVIRQIIVATLVCDSYYSTHLFQEATLAKLLSLTDSCYLLLPAIA